MSLVPAAIGKLVARNALHVQKASPEILLVAGIAGLVGSTVLACRATLKVEEILDESKEKFELVRTTQDPEYSEDDRKKDITLVYFQTGVKFAKAYGPSIALGVISIAALTKSNRILNNRNVALGAAYSALEKGFSEYRARVVDKYGEDEDRNFRYGTREDVVVDEKTGRKKKVTRVGLDEPSIYSRFFDSYSQNWNRDPEWNLMFLHCQQNYANDLLKSRGHVFLNEVYDMLGVPRSKAGAVVGWMLSGDGETDNYINFGIFDGTTEVLRDFVNGLEGAILLDFNVDGVIYNKLED